MPVRFTAVRIALLILAEGLVRPPFLIQMCSMPSSSAEPTEPLEPALLSLLSGLGFILGVG